MKSAKKYLAAILAVMHILTYSTPVQSQAADVDASATQGDLNASIEVGANPADFLPPVEGGSLPVENSSLDESSSIEVIPAEQPAVDAPALPSPVVINLVDGTTTNGGDIAIGSAEWYLVQIVDALGQVCPSCSAIWNLDSFVNAGNMDVIGNLAIIAPIIVNEGHITTTGDLILSNLGIDEKAFFEGMAQFEKETGLNPADSYILNTGDIAALNKKIVALIGGKDGVHNLGSIASEGGVVAMIAGDKVSFPITKDGLINVSSTDVTGVKGQVLDKDGKVVETNGLVTNSGLLQANGGAVVLQATGSEQALDQIINQTGIIQAQSISEENGRIILRSETGNILVNDASMDASGLDAGEKGGAVDILTQGNVIVDGSTTIDASGTNGGGKVDILATNIGMGSDVEVKANAVANGDGGTINIIAENVANIAATLSATGGSESGNGGGIETSGKEFLNIDNVAVDASAAKGEAGTWTLDPRNIEIVAGGAGSNVNNTGIANFATTGNNSQIGVNQINSQLNSGTNVTIATGGIFSPGAQAGNITVSAAIDKSSGNNTATLTLNAFNNIIVNAAMGATVGILNIVLNAGANNSNASVTVNSAINTTGDLTINADTNTNNSNLVDLNADVNARSIDIRNAQTVDLAGNVDLSTTGGDLEVSNNIGGIVLSGGSGTTNTFTSAGGEIDLDNITTANAAANSPNLTVTSNRDVNIDSADIKNGNLTVSVDANNNAARTGTFGALTAGTITVNGFGGNDDFSFNGAVTTKTGAVTINNANDVDFASTINTTGGGLVENGGTGTTTFNGLGTIGGNVLINAGSIDFDGAGSLNAGANSVTLNAATGNIDSGSAASDVIASSLTTTSVTGTTLDINVNNITASNSGAGNIVIREANGANVLNASAANGNTTVTTATGNLNVTTVSASGTATLTATAGAITDANAAANNVTATSLNATAATGIDLDTTATNLTASNTGAGNINLDEANGANVLNVSAANGNATVTSTTGDLNVTAVSASGTATLTASAGSITDANVAANNISANALSAYASGSVDLDTTVTTASVYGNGSVNINEADGMTISGGSGNSNATFTTATGDLNVMSIVANGLGATVNLLANAGAITDGNGSATNVSTTSLNATAATGIDLDTNVTNITASNTGAGNINIDEANGANVLNVSAANGNATVTSATGDLNVTTVSASGTATLTATAGAISDANAAANNVTANSLNATAASGIDLDTTVGDVTATVTGTGAIDLNDLAGGLVVNSATTNDGAITINATGGNLTATTVTAGGAGRDVLLSTTTSGNVVLGTVTALDDKVTVNSAAQIQELVNDDAGVPTADVVAGTIKLNSNGDTGAINSYLDINPSVKWGATTNGGNLYINCIGACPLDQVDLGTGTFYYAGNITDANDAVNGEHVGGIWNIRAGGVHLDANNAVNGFIGTASNWIEMQLANYAGVSGDMGRMVATAGTGGIHVSNDGGAGHPGLQIGGVSPSTITGLTSAGNIEVYSFSPLTVAANVLATGGASILLAAMGNDTADDLNVNANISATGGVGSIQLIAGDDVNLNGTSVVSANSTGQIRVYAGENFTDGILDRDGNAAGDITMASSTALRSTAGAIAMDATRNIALAEVNADSNIGGGQGNISIITTGGAVTDNNGGALNLRGDNVTIRSVNGVGSIANTIETKIDTLDLINTTSGQIGLVEIGGGSNGNDEDLEIVRLQQGSAGDTLVQTADGDLEVLASGFGVSAQSGELTLAANGFGANDDLRIFNTVTSTTGKVNLDSSSRDVLFSAAGDVTTTSGEIEVRAQSNVSMTNGTVLNAGDDLIDIDAETGNITLGSVQTTNASNDAVNLRASSGAVIDGGDLDVDIVAQSGRTNIIAKTGVGSANELDTQMKEVDVQNLDSGNIQIRELATGGNLDIINANQQALNGQLNIRTEDGSLTVVAAVDGGSGVAAKDGETRLFAADQNGSGDDHLILKNTVRSADGKINLDSENNVEATAEGDVTTGDTGRKSGATGAEIEVDALDSIKMESGTLFNAGNNVLDLDAGQNVTLGGLLTSSNSESAVVINSRGGSIIDGGDDFTNIQTGAAGGMLLSALNGIGDESTLDGGIETQAGLLAARTDSGDVQIFNQGNLTIKELTDNDPLTSLGQQGVTPNPVSGVSITDSINNNSGADHIFVKTDGNMIVDSPVSNLDGGDVTLYALDNNGLLVAPDGNMTINADIQSVGGNGKMRVVSFGNMTMGEFTDISTQGNGLTSGTGEVVVGAGYNANGKARDADIVLNPLLNANSLPGLNGQSLIDPSNSLLSTEGNPIASLTMAETARISSEGGDIVVDARNNFTVGRVDADGNAGANGITDGTRGNITAFARTGSILDAEGPGFEVGNLDFVANSLRMLAKGTIGLPNNHIEGDAPFLNTFSEGNQFVDMLGNTQVEMTSASGSIFLSATGNIFLGHINAPSGEVHATAGNSILSLGGDETRVTASNLIELIAGGVVGTQENAINTHLNATPAQINASAGTEQNGVSININSNVSAAALNLLNNPPGLVLFNGVPSGGQTLSGLIGDQSQVNYKPFVRNLPQYSDFDGTYSADFPGFSSVEALGFKPEISVDTTALTLPVRGVTVAPRVVPIPTPAVPTPVQPEQPVVQAPAVPVLANEPTPPAVVPIPANAVPSDEAKTQEGVPQTPVASN